MAHDHDHHDQEGYFLDQIFSIALCGALGVIAVLLYTRQKMLAIILAAPFHPYVLAGGITLLVLVAIRALALWKYTGEMESEHHHHFDHHHDAPCGLAACDQEHHDHDHAHGHHHEHPPELKGPALGLKLVEAPSPAHTHGLYHGHNHGHHHDHDHDHEHDHGHDHGWAPWRYTVLMLPVVLFLLNLPNEGFSARFKGVNVDEGHLEQTAAGTIGLLAPGGGPAPLLAAATLFVPRFGGGPIPFDNKDRPMVNRHDLRFSELEQAAFDPSMRARMTGQSATLIGKFVAGRDGDMFSLVRFRMNCCAADALPLNAVITVTPDWQGQRLDVKGRQQKWVRVIGRIYFLKKRGSADEYIPALILFPDKDHAPNELVEIIDTPAIPYAN